MKHPTIAILILLTFLCPAQALSGETAIIWHGHATVEVKTPAGTVLMIDPWLNNPKNPAGGDSKNPLSAVTRLDYILVTHAHFDHIGDAVALAKQTGARLVTNFELGQNMQKLLGYPAEQLGYDSLMNIGGEITLANGDVRVAMTQAIHSSGMDNPFAAEKQSPFVYGGNPAGFVLTIKDGPVIYHAGDTSFFSDMRLIGETYHPDIALLPAGGHFTMEPAMAARAAITVGARYSIPIHYGTFPVLAATPEIFITELGKAKSTALVPAPGDRLIYKGGTLTIAASP